MKAPSIQFETLAGEPIIVGRARITPFVRVLRLPFGRNGGIIWNRPIAVSVDTPGQEDQVIGIPDVTRQAQWALLGLSLAVALLFLLIKKIYALTTIPEATYGRDKNPYTNPL